MILVRVSDVRGAINHRVEDDDELFFVSISHGRVLSFHGFPQCEEKMFVGHKGSHYTESPLDQPEVDLCIHSNVNLVL